MTSTIKVDTISEKTSANGVAIDGLTIKDGGITTTTGDVVLNEASASVDFRVETNGQTHALFIDGSADAIGLFNSAPSFTTGSGMHLADDVKIGFGTGGSSRPDFQLSADSSNLKLACGFGADTADINISTGATISTGQETSPDASGGGLTLNQAANDTNIFTLKSSDVAHGVTDLDETDTWFSLRKFTASTGGVQMRSLAGGSDNCALFIDSVAGSEDTGKGTGDHGCTNIDAQKDNGTDKQGLASNGNLLTVSNDNHVRFIIDAEGDIHVDGSSSISTYDTYEDAQLVRAYDLSYGQTSKGLINSKFDKFINYNHDSLVEAGIIGVPNKKENEDGTEAYGLLNSTAMQRLHNGAIWQQYEKHQKLANAMYELAKAAVGEDKANEILKQNDIQLLN